MCSAYVHLSLLWEVGLLGLTAFVSPTLCVDESLYLAEILVYGLNDDVVERDAVELRVVEGFVLKHSGVKRLRHSASDALYRLASELGIAVWNLMAL